MNEDLKFCVWLRVSYSVRFLGALHTMQWTKKTGRVFSRPVEHFSIVYDTITIL